MSEKGFVVLGILCFIVGILTTLYIWFTNKLSVEDITYSQLLAKTHDLHNQNLQLEDQLLHEEAFHTIYQEAVKKGFQPATFIYIGVSNNGGL